LREAWQLHLTHVGEAEEATEEDIKEGGEEEKAPRFV
jgi:hypothetical protein